MADFTQIIQKINDDITTNGVGAITGAKLNEVLRDMIAAVNAEKQDPLMIDATPTEGSTNPVQSGGVYNGLEGKADKVQLATKNDIATLGANGNIKDSGISIDNVAMDANVVHKNGDETISGEKTFADKTIFGNEVKLIDANEIGATFYSSEEGKIEFYGSPGEGTVQLKNITSPSASSDAATKGYVDGEIAGKQDTISDLATIRTGAAAGATAYQKPSGGIPKTDLASGVQTSLGKADTSIQNMSTPLSPDGTITATKANGDTIIIDLNHQHPNYYSKVAETTQPSGGMLPDVTYKLGTLTGATTFSFAAAVSGNVNHYYFTFISGTTTVIPTWPASITSWDGNCVDSNTGLPVIAANKTYEVSVLDGNAIIKEW